MEQRSILIVEDEQIPAIDLRETLITLGYRVTGIASSGERAIEMADEGIPDLILMDIRLAGKLSGIEAAEQILKHHTIPIIYLTAYADPELVERAKRTRPYGYIIKPYDERGIRTEIEIALYKAELDRKLEQEYANLEQRVIDRTNELTRINAALQKSETRYRLLFERSGEGIFIFEAQGKDQGRIVEVNNAGAAMHGYTSEELLTMKIADLEVAENLTDTPARFKEILSGKWIGGVINHKRKDGSVFPLDFHAGLLELEGHTYVFSVMHDFSEQKRVHDEVVKARDEWERTFNAVPDLISIIDKNFRIVRINKAMAERIGVSAENAIGLRCYESVHHTSNPPDICPHQRLLADGKPHTVDIHEDNLNGDFTLTVSPILDPSGTIAGSVHVLHDITLRKRAEDALKESEANYRTILEDMQDMFYRTDLQGKITMLSPAGVRLAGYDSPDDLIGLDAASVYAEPEERKQLLSVLAEKGEVSDYPITLKVRDGSLRYATTSSHFYRDAHGKVLGVEGIIHDITSLRQAEDTLRMVNKKLNLLSSITRHDIRNQLMALKTYIQLSEDSLGKPAHVMEFLKKQEKISDNIERQINFTSDYEEMGVKSPAWQNIEAIVSRVASEHLLRDTRVETTCPDLEIFADPLLEKVFYNLIDNALRYGGEQMTVIRTTMQESEGGMVISVKDDGVGISAEDKKHLFSRGFGHNTGLGLFLSREILSITGIMITEDGEPGKGARFEILVPKGGWRFTSKP
ncbi:MAG: PAS domain S-box protein [Methanoregula sp.]